ncbi:MAG: TauD/TfdA family dioxygenase [Actinobacteria bacterium]|nr:TauD/TfdA family dioxygenase [Actinomycetota bacterium]
MRTPQHGAAVWRTADVQADTSWCVEFTDAQRDELVATTRSAAAAGVTVATVARDTFVLPTLAAHVAEWSHQLESGRGFLLLRRFPIDVLTEHETELAYAGLGSHFGTLVGQNKEAELLTHVRDERLPPDAGKVRLYRTRERQDFHTDGADIIGLLCLHRARSGGESRLVSSWALYNEILRTRPDLLEALYQPTGWDRQGDIPAGEQPFFMLAPINDIGGVPRVFYLGWYIRDAQQHPEVPRLTPAQLEAMELLEALANDPTFHIEMDFQPGDVQLLNNGRILHAREAYEDDPDPAERRHLLRLWMAAHRFTSLEDGLRGGVATPAVESNT